VAKNEFHVKQKWRLWLRQFFCDHAWVFTRFLPAAGGRIIQHKCLNCGKRRRNEFLGSG